jgi:hypothetical protein
MTDAHEFEDPENSTGIDVKGFIDDAFQPVSNDDFDLADLVFMTPESSDKVDFGDAIPGQSSKTSVLETGLDMMRFFSSQSNLIDHGIDFLFPDGSGTGPFVDMPISWMFWTIPPSTLSSRHLYHQRP